MKNMKNVINKNTYNKAISIKNIYIIATKINITRSPLLVVYLKSLISAEVFINSTANYFAAIVFK